MDGEGSIADLEIGKECHLSLGLARHKTKLDRVIGLVVAVREPAAVRDQLRQGWNLGGHHRLVGKAAVHCKPMP